MPRSQVYHLFLSSWVFWAFLIFPNLIWSQDATSVSRIYPDRLDSVMMMGIDSMAFPGGQLIIYHGDRIIHQKAYGHHTYAEKQPVEMSDLYDLASVTKVTTAVPALMYLIDRRFIHLDQTLCEIFPQLCGSNKEDLTLRAVLAHQARLQPYIVFWQEAQRKNGRFKRRSFKAEPSANYPIKLTDSIYLHRNYQRKMLRSIRRSPLRDKTEYLYSGLTFLLYPELVKRTTGIRIDSFLRQEFYDKIGATTTGYRPADRFPLDRIVPTELDTFFRKQLVHGTVHDEAAAMLDGISSNAGLFSSAPDLLKLLKLFLNRGKYQEEQLIQEATVDVFTRCTYCELGNRRGLGFDKPPLNYDQASSYVAPSASPSSYGHSGFTGTFFWIDPAHELIFLLLTNRVHPTRNQRKLYSLGLRPKLHQIAYDWIAEIEGKKKGESQ